MTFFHLMNCLALACVPNVIVYKFSGLADYSAFWKCAQAAGAYVLTQLIKMIALATFFPTVNPDSSVLVTGMLDVVRATVDIIDLVGLALVLQRLASGKAQIRLLTAGLGWAAADLLTTRLLPLWVGTRGPEFHWRFVRLALQSNLDLANHLAVTLLVWLYCRHDLEKRRLLPTVVMALLFTVYRPMLHDMALQARPSAEMALFAANATAITLVGLLALSLFHRWSAEVAARPATSSSNGKGGHVAVH